MQKNNIKIALKVLTIIYLALFSFASSSYAAKHPEVCQYLYKTASEQDKSRGENVRQIQIVLIKERYANFGTPSGFYGPKTTEAIKFFQSLNGIYPVGSTGPMTLAKMRSLWCSNSNNSESEDTDSNISNTTNSGAMKINFSADLESSEPKIIWSSENVQSCKMDNEEVDTSGEKIIDDNNATTTYVLSCSGNSGVSSSKTLTIYPAVTNNTSGDNSSDDSTDDSSEYTEEEDNYTDDSSEDYTEDYTEYDNSSDFTQDDDYSNESSQDDNLSIDESDTVSEEIIPITNSTSTTTTSSVATTTSTTPTKALPTPSITSFKSTQTKTGSVTKLKFSWQTKNIKSCKINGGTLKNVSVKANGTYDVTAPKATTVYILICTNGQKNLTKRITITPKVTVTVKTPTPSPTISLSANPAKVTKTQKANLTWKTSGLTACTIDNNIGKVSNSGTKSISITKTTIFTLTCKTTTNKTYTKKLTIGLLPSTK